MTHRKSQDDGFRGLTILSYNKSWIESKVFLMPIPPEFIQNGNEYTKTMHCFLLWLVANNKVQINPLENGRNDARNAFFHPIYDLLIAILP